MKTTADTITDDLSIGLAPIESETAEYLILGTLPGAESLEKQQYYANKKNQFWTIMSNLLKEEKLIEVSYNERIDIIKRHNIALWDVLKGANRAGSSDNEIKNPVYNDIVGFLNSHPSVHTIVFNGKKAQKFFDEYKKGISLPSRIKIIELSSTSSANTRLSLPGKIKDWGQLFK